jgi:hypothetical protein
MFQQCYILFPFLSADLVIVATVPLAFEADICMIYWQYLCFLNPYLSKVHVYKVPTCYIYTIIDFSF